VETTRFNAVGALPDLQRAGPCDFAIEGAAKRPGGVRPGSNCPRVTIPQKAVFSFAFE